jgi:hypothetical protein
MWLIQQSLINQATLRQPVSTDFVELATSFMAWRLTSTVLNAREGERAPSLLLSTMMNHGVVSSPFILDNFY